MVAMKNQKDFSKTLREVAASSFFPMQCGAQSMAMGPFLPERPHAQQLNANRVGRNAGRAGGFVFNMAPAEESGFTLVELMIVMLIIGVLAAIAIPSYTASMKNAREATLKVDLQVMRQAIDSYTLDKEKAPQSLDELVQAGYLKEIPRDPITQSNTTWNPDQDDSLTSVDQTQGGIANVHSGSGQPGTDGRAYSEW